MSDVKRDKDGKLVLTKMNPAFKNCKLVDAVTKDNQECLIRFHPNSDWYQVLTLDSKQLCVTEDKNIKVTLQYLQSKFDNVRFRY